MVELHTPGRVKLTFHMSSSFFNLDPREGEFVLYMYR